MATNVLKYISTDAGNCRLLYVSTLHKINYVLVKDTNTSFILHTITQSGEPCTPVDIAKFDLQIPLGDTMVDFLATQFIMNL
jgi:hypothetical protein